MKKLKTQFITILLIILICAIGLFIILSPANEKRFASYVGSTNSDIYHRFDCDLVNEIEEKDKIWFDATIINENARYKGKQYFPCQVCKPLHKRAE